MSYLVVEFKTGIDVVEMRAAVAGLVNPELQGNIVQTMMILAKS
ncbi:MAG: hypothetical protein WBP64_08755 [Nitrososphaeraceae archaeon]